MNIDIQNYGHYRLTSHGGRRFDLFNREDDLVYSLTKDEYEYIRSHSDKEGACLTIENSILASVEINY